MVSERRSSSAVMRALGIGGAALFVVMVVVGVRWLAEPGVSRGGPSIVSTRAGEVAAPSAAATNSSSGSEESVEARVSSEGEVAEHEQGIEASPASGVPIVVVDRESGAARPGAIVTRIDPMRDRAPWEEIGPDLDRLLDVVGRRFRADEKGRVRVPPSAGPLDVYARSVGRVGYARLEATDMVVAGEDATAPAAEPILDPILEPIAKQLEVGLWGTLRLKTVDARGRPRGGIPLVIESGVNSSALNFFPLESRAADGMVEVRGANLWFDDGAWPPGIGIRVDLPLRKPVSVRVLPEDLDGPPVRLVVPETGRVEVSIRDREGALVELDGSGDIRIARRPPDEPSLSHDEPFEDDSIEVELVKGRGKVEHVPLGGWLYVDGWWRPFGQVRGSAPGPRSDGETVELVLRQTETPLEFTGRAVDPAGAPLTGSRLRADFLFRAGMSSSGTNGQEALGADGSFRFLVHRGPALWAGVDWDEGDVSFRLEHPGGGVAMRGEAGLSAELVRHGGSLGTIVLSPCGLLAAGVVVDDRGEPLEHVGVQLARVRRTEGRDRRGIRIVNEEILHDFTARSRAEGRFEIHGDPGPGELVLRVRSSRLGASGPVPIEPGARDARLVLERFAAFEARVRLDPGIPPTAVMAQLSLRPRDDDPPYIGVSLAADGAGRLIHREIPPPASR